MYETLEHWKQYKQEKDLQTKIAKQEMDKFLNKITTKNCTTKY